MGTTGSALPSEVSDVQQGRGWTATAMAALGALAMTSCCILPLVLVSFGVTGVFIAQMGALYAYKWYTFGTAAAFLGYGFYRAYQPIRCADGTCARPMTRTAMRAVLWVAAAVISVAMLFPYASPYILSF
ncbi:mercuric transporter MerT family protein [Aurantimonas coralicida]|uniref:mercuric transporter MerT family protein n=1 Tax=Aurantimonas coralicida TaxID=182270 RepID=UPI00165EAFA6|nr:mercuric transporter MerT family protein [Aurantimonas coralicida]MCC4298528.1 mercury transporter [Aurantimonas coralicida]